ncbi:MAG: hypothetical protein LQ350_005929 [Teloschistes chrysophthalmus]|nr:MAG: hypothetical protein LQ350_005929 [Niorma chrysophthalma]
MVSSIYVLLSAASLAAALIVPRQNGVFQTVPTTAKPDNTFSNGADLYARVPPDDLTTPVPKEYAVRPLDIPFGRLSHGNMKFFAAGELNTPTGKTDVWAKQNDFANQSACGIPDNAFSISKVAIHPYWLKYAPLDRYCMQDVCISFWNEQTEQTKQSDMMLKVTDICSTDPKDPTHCETPLDIKVDRTKAQIMEHMTDGKWEDNPALNGNQFGGGKTWWFFMKCWADGIAQPAYQGSANNWFTTPALPSNQGWAQKAQESQWQNNQDSYPIRGWQKYPNGAYRMDRNAETSPPLDWSPGDPVPEWCPVAGGKGHGQPTGKNCHGVASEVNANWDQNRTDSGTYPGQSGGGRNTGGGGAGSNNNTSTPATTPVEVPPSTTSAPKSGSGSGSYSGPGNNGGGTSGNNSTSATEPQGPDEEDEDDTCEP